MLNRIKTHPFDLDFQTIENFKLKTYKMPKSVYGSASAPVPEATLKV